MQTVYESEEKRMSRFLGSAYRSLDPYVPGEQPQNQRFIKLNTNENPFPPSPRVVAAASEEAKRLNLYSDPDLNVFLNPFSSYMKVDREQVFAGNGSDEILAIIFQALCEDGVIYPDISYGFYKVYAALYNLKSREIPLKEDFTLDPRDYYNAGATIVIANPNAPTGIAVTREDIRGILEHNRNNLVVVDEAYVEFGAETVVPLVKEYDNLLVVGTFSKSRSLAGGRLGYAVSNSGIIEDLNRIKFSINPYNVNRMTLAAGAASLEDDGYFTECVRTVVQNREYTVNELKKLGFLTTDSSANFIFVSHGMISGGHIYNRLRENGILVRWFNRPVIKDYLRITIGSAADMDRLLKVLKNIVEEEL